MYSRNTVSKVSDAVIQRFPFALRQHSLLVRQNKQKRKTGRRYGKFKNGVTPANLPENAVHCVQVADGRSTSRSGNLLRQKPTSIDGGYAVGNGRATAREIFSWRERRAATTEMQQ